MKRLKIVLIILTIFLAKESFAQGIWDNSFASPNPNDKITCIKFINADVGYVGMSSTTGYNNRLLKTTNKGVNWFVVKQFGSNENRVVFDFKDENNGIIGNDDQIYSTTDGGQNTHLISGFPSQNTTNIKVSSVKYIGTNTAEIFASEIYTDNQSNKFAQIEFGQVSDGANYTNRTLIGTINSQNNAEYTISGVDYDDLNQNRVIAGYFQANPTSYQSFCVYITQRIIQF